MAREKKIFILPPFNGSLRYVNDEMSRTVGVVAQDDASDDFIFYPTRRRMKRYWTEEPVAGSCLEELEAKILKLNRGKSE